MKDGVVVQTFTTWTGVEFAKGLLDEEGIEYVVKTASDDVSVNLKQSSKKLVVSACDVSRAKEALKFIDDIDEVES